MANLYLFVTDNYYIYGKLNIEQNKVENCEIKLTNRQTDFLRIWIDSAFIHYFCKELLMSKAYRIKFIQNFNKHLNSVNKVYVEFILKPTETDLIDYIWNERVYIMCREKCELEHALSWLSTLGGAFSALGDYYDDCAKTAAKISVNQLRLAIRLGDPGIAARCRLYLALSLIQRKQYKLAKAIITNEYHKAKSLTVMDIRLIRMCKGIWSKLQYEHFLFKKIGHKTH